ncbi:MAG: endo-1,4-beta-xylanase [Anaerolineae bacterium]|nr:endo-1,4-beta-xylanase [Anaerolineae bacterium]
MSETTGKLRALLGDIPGFYVGAAVRPDRIAGEPQYAETLAREFNMLVAENHMKMKFTQPRRGEFEFTAADAVVVFAQANDMAVRGHTLVWHLAVPGWVTERELSRGEAIDILHTHIDAVVRHFKGKVMAWDVMNEAIDHDDPTRLRETIWYRAIGPDYLDMIFRRAHEADPDALLFYNDYEAEGMNAKSDAVYELMKDLLARGVPLHGVGLQMHISVEDFGPDKPLNAQTLAANIERLGALGLQVHVTEMDVRTPNEHAPEARARRTEIYREVFEVCLAQEACTAFLTWGFTDKYTWVPKFFEIPDAAPLLFDADYQPKPAYDAMVEALKHYKERLGT